MTHLKIVIQIAKQIETYKFGKLNSTGVCTITRYFIGIHNINFRIVLPRLKSVILLLVVVL